MIRKRNGFTLVELLVVVAIIIILAAILFPVFAKARDKAQQARCLNNVKQIGIAVQMYEDDYEGAVLPIGLLASGGEWTWIAGHSWEDLVNPYLKQRKAGTVGGQVQGQGQIIVCPSAPQETATGGLTWQVGKYYGYNNYLQPDTSPSQVKYPSLTLRVTEVGDYWFDPHNPAIKDPGYKGGSFLAPMPKKVSGSSLNLTSPGWHNGFSHVLWFDGHVSAIPWERVMYSDAYQGTTDPNVWCRLEPKDGRTPEG